MGTACRPGQPAVHTAWESMIIAAKQADADAYCRHTGELTDLLSWSNHPNRAGHLLVARALMRWFTPA